MPTAPSLKHCLRVASQAAREAGVLLVKHAGRPRRIDTKSSAIDLVTEVDRAAEDLIFRRLLGAFPDHGFQGEERPMQRGKTPYRWIVDPLDGTTNFVHGVPLFGVSIGLTYHNTLLVGVIFDPTRSELFAAYRGGGATLNGKRMRVSTTTRLSSGLLSTGFATSFRKHSKRYLQWLKTFELGSRAVRRIGSTALSLAYIASGRLDGFYEEHLWPWDIAAGILLVREAGGRVTDFSGKNPDLERGELIASNGKIHRAIISRLSR